MTMTNRVACPETLRQNSQLWNRCVGYSGVDTGNGETYVPSKLPTADGLGGLDMSCACSEPQETEVGPLRGLS